jgi:hypothetical protein
MIVGHVSKKWHTCLIYPFYKYLASCYTLRFCGIKIITAKEEGHRYWKWSGHVTVTHRQLKPLQMFLA